ncbi:MAG: hypothetical protein GY705_27560, partial [Bacteroidetes bacterium]|nr:hypothetical protein [Bacteroidota bacterium]
MKSGILLFILLSTPYFLIAQWQSLGSNNTPNEKNNGIMGVFAPSEDVIWGTVWNRQDFSPSHVFIKSVDGGTTVTSGSINTEDATLAPLGIFALDENTAWIGMASEPCQCYGQVYKTTDGGDTWTKQFSTDSNQSLGGIYFWDEHEGFVFGSDGTGNLSDKYVVYHTTDGGATWNETSPTQLETGEGMWIGSVNGIFEVIGDNIWFGSRKGRVFKSSDRGITWKVSETFAPGRTINAIAFKDEWNGIALSTINASNKAWKTVDGGMSWTEIGIPPNPSAYSIQYIPETPNTYVVSGGWDSPGMLITTNGGDNWKTLSTPPLIGTYFLSPTTGYGGGDILDDNKGGLYKFISSLDSSHINVVTLAGSSMEGVRTGNGESAKFWNPKGMTMDEEGNLYVAGDYSLQIHKITPAGEVSIVAGSGGYGYEDGPAEEAQFARPHGVVLDDEGNLFVADFFNAVIRKITPEGIVSTWAGTGEQGGQDGAAGTATFGRLSDIVKDVYGNFYVADNNKIRKINNEGIVSTLAGSDEPGFMDGMGADARFYFIWGLGIDTDGNIYAADFFNHAIRKITPQGEVTTVAGTGNPGYLDGAGTIAKFSAPEDVAVDGQGNIYVADGQNFRVRKIAPDGMVSTVCGIGDPSYFYLDGGQPLIDGEGDFAQFGRLRSILVKPDGNLLVSSWSNDAIREIQIGMPSNALQVIELGSDKPYRFTPIEHQNNFQFSSTVFNMSIEIIDGVQMKVSVLQEDNILYEESSTPVSVEDFGEQVLWLVS